MNKQNFERCKSLFETEIALHPSHNFSSLLSSTRMWSGKKVGFTKKQKEVLHKEYKKQNFSRMNEIVKYAKLCSNDFPFKDMLEASSKLKVKINRDIFTRLCEVVWDEELKGDGRDSIRHAIYRKLRELKENQKET